MLSQTPVCSLTLVLCNEGTLKSVRYTNGPVFTFILAGSLFKLGNVVESSAEKISANTDGYYEKLSWEVSG